MILKQKNLLFLFLLLITPPLCAAEKTPLLREGTLIRSVEGKMTQNKQGKYFFRFHTDVNDFRETIKAGSPLELLPSAALQEMIEISKSSSVTSFMLDSRVTLYNNQNYLFPVYAMPLIKIPPVKSEPEKQPGEPNSPSVKLEDPNDIISIPEEIRKRLKPQRVIRPAQLIEKPVKKQKYDSILADRTGFIVRTDPNSCCFKFDALGRNINEVSIPLLPCQTLQIALQQQSKSPYPVRFRVAGIVTRYKDKYYLLLQRAAKKYSYGNFTN